MKIISRAAESVLPRDMMNAKDNLSSRSSRKIWLFIPFLLLLLMAGFFFFNSFKGVIFGKAIEAGNVINGCTNSGWVSGQTYTLSGNINVQDRENCLVFTGVTGVTLDCRQNSLTRAGGNSANGIIIDSSSSNIKIKNCNFFGLDINVNGNNNQLTNNYFDASRTYLRGSGNTYANNFAKGQPSTRGARWGSVGTALEIIGSNNVVENNELRTLSYAIVVEGARATTIRNNFLENTRGLTLVGDDTIVTGNEIINNFGGGAAFIGQRLTFNNNIICGSSGSSGTVISYKLATDGSHPFLASAASGNYLNLVTCFSDSSSSCAPAVSGTNCANVPVTARVDKCLAKECGGSCGSACPENLVCNEDGQCIGCGNRVRDPGEACDDGNRVNGDGCSSVCLAELGYQCSGNGGGLSVCVVQTTCGNRLVEGSEQCDDGNQRNEDQCSNTCQRARCGDAIVQQPNADGGTEVCDDANQDNTDSCTVSCQSAFCGDGFVRAGVEQCDDRNNAPGDGCSAGCQVEVAAVCGNGLRDGFEDCDDGNTVNGDGCSSSCVEEAAPLCGNSVIERGEICDDGNRNGGDGCAFNCQIETGWSCTTGSSGNSGRSQCSAAVQDTDRDLICDGTTGAGSICRAGPDNCPTVINSDQKDSDGDGYGDACDGLDHYTNSNINTNCQDSRQCLQGLTCQNGLCLLACGNQARDSGEQCDNGGKCSNGNLCAIGETSCADGSLCRTDSNDGCDTQCRLETGWQCLGDGLECTKLCGNGLMDQRDDYQEQCDDGNLNNNDGCSGQCLLENGYSCPQAGQACVQQSDYELSSCRPPGGQWLPGRTYRFVTDYFEVSCNLQNVQNVIIDCDGHSISGLRLQDSTAVTVRNCNIVGSGSAAGIDINGGYGHKLQDNNIYRGTGISILNSRNNLVRGNLLKNNQFKGLSLGSSSNNVIEKNKLVNTNLVLLASNDNTFTENIIADWRFGGSNNRYMGNEFQNNVFTADYLTASLPDTFENNYCEITTYCLPRKDVGDPLICGRRDFCSPGSSRPNPLLTYECATVELQGGSFGSCSGGKQCNLDGQCAYADQSGTCGDNRQQPAREECDDGNVLGGDGCSSQCYLEDEEFPCSGAACNCPTGYSKCGSICADLKKNNNHCGACFDSCPAGSACAIPQADRNPGCFRISGDYLEVAKVRIIPTGVSDPGVSGGDLPSGIPAGGVGSTGDGGEIAAPDSCPAGTDKLIFRDGSVRCDQILQQVRAAVQQPTDGPSLLSAIRQAVADYFSRIRR